MLPLLIAYEYYYIYKIPAQLLLKYCLIADRKSRGTTGKNMAADYLVYLFMRLCGEGLVTAFVQPKTAHHFLRNTCAENPLTKSFDFVSGLDLRYHPGGLTETVLGSIGVTASRLLQIFKRVVVVLLGVQIFVHVFRIAGQAAHGAFHGKALAAGGQIEYDRALAV